MILGNGASRAEKRFKAVIKPLIDKLKEAILAGKLAPGEPLSEADLAVVLKVDTVALREALRSLESEGYVTFGPADRIIVSKPSCEELEDDYTIAGVLEGLAARLAVERARPAEVERLRELHQALKEAHRKRDLLAYFDANGEFHRFIAEIARNEQLYRLIEQLRHEIRKTKTLLLQLPQRLDHSMREHDQIMDAFLKKNSPLAESTAVRHLKNQMETLRKVAGAAKGKNL